MHQFGYELLKMFARKRTYIGYGAFTVVMVTILGLLQLPAAKRSFESLLGSNGYAFQDFYGGLTLAVVMIVTTFMLLGALYLALVSGDIISKEVEEGTMRMVLARPISRVRLLLIKWASCTVYTVTLIAFLGVVALVAATVYRGYLGKLFVFVPEEGLFGVFDAGEGLWRYARALLFLALSAQVISNMAFMFSCFRMKPAAATILTLSILFFDLVLRNIPYFADYKRFFITNHTVKWTHTFFDPTPWHTIGQSYIYLLALNATLVVIGMVRFSTRDLKV